MIRCFANQTRVIWNLKGFSHTQTFSNSVMLAAQRRMASIQASPKLTLMDDKVKVILNGLEPGSNVTVRSQLTESVLKMRFEAHAHYQANDQGEISLNENSSLGGSFTGVEPMGMFWSMAPSPGQRAGLRYSKKDVTTPQDITLSVYNGHVNTVEAFDQVEPIGETVVQKTYMAANVERQKVNHGRIRGMMYKPKGPGPFPAIIDMFGTAGGILEFRSALLASRGFVSYSLPFFLYEDLPKTLEDIQLEYFEEAIDWLMSHDFVLPGGIGTVGVSSGGELSLLLATFFPDKVKAAVNINGSTAHMTPGITYKGVEFPMQDFEMSGMTFCDDGSMYGLHAFPDPSSWNKDIFVKVERAKAQFLHIIGGADLNWPSEGMADQSIERMTTHGKDNYELLKYEHAGHLIEPPYAPVCIKSYHKTWGRVVRWGGSLKEHNDAQVDSWPKMLQFFSQNLAGVPYERLVQQQTSSKL